MSHGTEDAIGETGHVLPCLALSGLVLSDLILDRGPSPSVRDLGCRVAEAHGGVHRPRLKVSVSGPG